MRNIPIFQLNELEEKVQERVIEEYRSTVENLLIDEMIDEFSRMTNLIFPNSKVSVAYSFCGQGSGINIEGDIDIMDFITKGIRDKSPMLEDLITLKDVFERKDAAQRVIHLQKNQCYTYSCKFMDIKGIPGHMESLGVYEGDECAAAVERLLNRIFSNLENTERCLYDMCVNARSECTDDVVRDFIEMSGYEFTKEGKRWRQ